MSIEVYFILAIIGFCTFFICKSIFNKFIKEPKKKRIAIWLTTIIGTPIIYVLIILTFIFSISYYTEKNFDSKTWKNDVENRFELSGDLINSGLLIGKTKKQVEQILGKPEDFKADLWVYDLGFVPSLGNIDPDILEITFKNGKVIKVIQRNT